MLCAVCLLGLGLIGARAVWVQLIEAPQLTGLVDGQLRVNEPIPAVRGTISDRLGRPLAISKSAVTVAATRQFVGNNAGAYATVLAPILHRPEPWLARRMSDRRFDYVYLARQLDASVEQRVVRALAAARLNRSAISFPTEPKRAYPGHVAYQLLGATNPDGTGIAGAELSLNGLLHGTAGDRTVVRGTDGKVVEYLADKPEVSGKNVRLTIDSSIQGAAERVAVQLRTAEKADAVTITVLEPATGGVFAMASAPSVPVTGYTHATLDEQRIRAITDGYEPGSTFKVATIGAALQLGLVTPDQVFTVPDSMTLDGQTIRDADEHPTQQMTVSQILAESSNVGTVTIARQVLGKQALSKFITQLGFGTSTGIDLPGEISGQLLPLAKWSGTSILSFPIGEGMLVTPLQMAALYAAIANGGVWHTPHIVESVDGHPVRGTKTRRVYTAATARALSTMLQQVVTDSVGTGTKAQLPGYRVAGKTGTAPKLYGKVYDGAKAGYNSSFVGYVPADHPRVVILVLVDHPRVGSYFGGDVAAPAFRQVAAAAMSALGVPADEPVPASSAG